MKKIFKLFLIIITMFFSVFALASCNKEGPKDTTPSVLNVAVFTPYHGTFLGNYFSSGDNSSTIESLILGYNPITFTKNAKYEIDKTVVKDCLVEEIDGLGTKYTLKLNEDLKWSNGDNLTAKDYVGTLLLFRNALYNETINQRFLFGEHILGTEEYYDDKSGLGELVGVSLISDYEFSFISKNDASFQNITDLSIRPYPMNVLMPGVTIEQGENGAKFSGKTTDELKTILYQTIENEGKGYKYNPSVTCGPYKIGHIEEVCVLLKNDYYKGNYEGQKPQIDIIRLRYVDDKVSAFNRGEIDFYEGSLTKEDLEKIDPESIKTTYYDFTSVYSLAFHADKGASRFKEIRQAVAYLMTLKNIHGDYNLQQWMTKEAQDKNGNVLGINLKGEKTPLNKYELNIEKAQELIEKAGYIYGDEAATRLYTSEDSVRYRKNDDGTVEKLTLEIIVNIDFKNVFDELVKNAKEIGFNITVTVGNFNYTYDYYYGFKGDGYENRPENATYEEILASYNKETDNRVGNAYFYPKNYGINLTDASYYTCLENWGNEGNINFLYDEAFDNSAKNLDKAKTIEEYLEAWQKYQYQYNENLPTIPFDVSNCSVFFSSKLKGLEGNIDNNWDWKDQILYCEIEK